MNLDTDIPTESEKATTHLIDVDLKKFEAIVAKTLNRPTFENSCRGEDLSNAVYIATILHCTFDPDAAQKLLAKVYQRCGKSGDEKEIGFNEKAMRRVRDALLVFEKRHAKLLPRRHRWFAVFRTTGECISQSFSLRWLERMFPRKSKYAFVCRVTYRTNKGAHCIHAVSIVGILYRECNL